MNFSVSIEDYAKALLNLGADEQAVSNKEVATCLDVAPASVTTQLQRMEQLHLVTCERYRGSCLTEEGIHLARRQQRRHRLIEMYLVQGLHMDPNHVHLEAERLEHAISDRVLALMAENIGHPTHDPHGQPICSAQEATV